MVGGTKLSSVEQGQIRVLKQQKLSLRAIAAAIGRSKTAIANSLKDPDAYSAKKRKGKAHKLSERNHRAVFRHATLHKKTSSQIVPLLSQRVSARTARRELQCNGNAKYVKRSAKLFSRQNGGGSLIIWGGFSAVGTTKMAILPGRQDSFDYQQTLTTHLFLLADEQMSGSYIFQRDNVSIHSSAATRAFLNDLNIPVLP